MVSEFGLLWSILATVMILIVAGTVVGAFFLWLSAKMFKLRNQSFMKPLIISFIVNASDFVIYPFNDAFSFIVGTCLAIWLIKQKYQIAWGKSFLVWLTALVPSFVIMYALYLAGLIRLTALS